MSVTDLAPWLTTVRASTTDWDFTVQVILDDEADSPACRYMPEQHFRGGGDVTMGVGDQGFWVILCMVSSSWDLNTVKG